MAAKKIDLYWCVHRPEGARGRSDARSPQRVGAPALAAALWGLAVLTTAGLQ